MNTPTDDIKTREVILDIEKIDLKVGSLSIRKSGLSDPEVMIDGKLLDFKGQLIKAITVNFRVGNATTTSFEIMDLERKDHGTKQSEKGRQ